MNGTLIFFYNFFEEVKFEFPSLNCGKDGKHGEAGHRREQSDWEGWSDSGMLDSLFFAKQKATQKIKIKCKKLMEID